MSSPFFTVGIPTYNRKKYLGFSINAVLAQSFSDFELLIYDNGSTDDTSELISSYNDPRIRYVRRKENAGPCRNFVDTAAEARGDFFVLNQDDDLIHRDFLLRCHQAVKDHPEVSMYAAPAWREKRGRGYQGRLLRCNEGYIHDYLLNDNILYMDGKRMAVAMLNLFYYFYHPSIAIRSSTLKRTGGYVAREDCLFDIVNEAKVLMHGDLAYDPRPGAMYRDHAENEWKTYGRERRKKLLAGTLDEILKELEKNQIEWEPLFDIELAGYSKKDLEAAIKEWAWCNGPDLLISKGIDTLKKQSKSSSASFFLRLVRLIGAKRSLIHIIK